METGNKPLTVKSWEVERKMDYLDRLIKLRDGNMITVKAGEDRIERVCDSIEKDLGLKSSMENVDLGGNPFYKVSIPLRDENGDEL